MSFRLRALPAVISSVSPPRQPENFRWSRSDHQRCRCLAPAMRQPAFTSSIITGPIVSSATSDAGRAVNPDKALDRVLLRGSRKAPGIDQAPVLAPAADRDLPVADRILQADRSPEGPDRDRQAAQVLLVLGLLVPARQAPDRVLPVLDQVLLALDRALSVRDRAMERDQARVLDTARGPVAPDRHRGPAMALLAFAASRAERRYSQRKAR